MRPEKRNYPEKDFFLQSSQKDISTHPPAGQGRAPALFFEWQTMRPMVHPLTGTYIESYRSPLLSPLDRLKEQLLSQLSEEQKNSWFQHLSFSLLNEERGPLIVTFPHEIFFRWYSDVGRSLLEKSIRHTLGDMPFFYEWPGRQVPLHSLKNGSSLQNSFEDFIPGGKNREVVNMFRSSLHGKPGIILLQGASGTGKSHLLHAAFSVLKENIQGKVCFFSGSEFLSLFLSSYEATHRALLDCSAILVDDIQILEYHPHIQNTLAAFLDDRKDTFFISAYRTDEHDGNGQKLQPMLYDRLCSHLSLKLEEPDLDVRLRFTQICMERMGLPENRSSALFLARRCLRLRHIRGILEQVLHRYEQYHILPSVNEMNDLLSRAGAPQTVDSESILAVVASRYGCTSTELRENTKDRRLVLPRQTAMYLCREILGESYPSIGILFGGKDHSTVMHAVRKIEKLKVTNKDMNIQLTELTKQCRNGLAKGDN